MQLKLDGKGPLYQQIHQTLRRMILAGGLPADSRLPSTRVLRHELRVSRNTAFQHPLQELLHALPRERLQRLPGRA